MTAAETRSLWSEVGGSFAAEPGVMAVRRGEVRGSCCIPQEKGLAGR